MTAYTNMITASQQDTLPDESTTPPKTDPTAERVKEIEQEGEAKKMALKAKQITNEKRSKTEMEALDQKHKIEQAELAT